jgi:hypothetical protein
MITPHVALSFLLGLGLAMPSQASAMDVHSFEDEGSIRVTVNPDRTVSFEHCRDSAGQRCRVLGKLQKYTLDEVRDKRDLLEKQSRRLGYTEGGFVAVSAVLGGLGVVAGATNPVGWGVIAASAALGGAGGAIWTVRFWANPDATTSWSLGKDAATLNESIIRDHEVWTGERTSELARRLEKVLDSI